MKKSNIKSILLVFVMVVALGTTLMTSCIGFTGGTTTQTTTYPDTVLNETWTPPSGDDSLTQLPSIADVVALVKPSVVAITTETAVHDIFNQQYTQEGAGSGWIIDPNGIIVTNNHVVEGAKTITVTMDDGATYQADINKVYTDSLNDLAIIKINATNLPYLKTGNSGNMRIGDWVIAIGNALGQGTRATEGIISRKGVTLEMDQDQSLYDLLETSAAINAGNSGGPLVNLEGEVIGITSAKIASVGVEGMGYAISINTALPIIQELVNKGYITRPYIGVRLYTVDQYAIAQLHLNIREGVVITEIVFEGPADKAGLKPYDVIISIEGIQVKTAAEFMKVLYSSTIGQPLEIKYWRGDKEYTVMVTPIKTPKP
jgi:serine protease Do